MGTPLVTEPLKCSTHLRQGASLALPFARLPVPHTAFESRAVPVTLSVQTSEKLSAVACDQGLAFLAGWGVLLWRYTDQPKIAIGVVSEEGLVEPLRLSFSETLSFKQIMEQVRIERTAASSSRDLLDAEMIESILFRMDNSTKEPSPPVSLPQFELMLCVFSSGGVYNAELRYDARVFPQSAVERMSRSLASLLTAAANLDSIAYDLPILNQEDWDQIVVKLNETAALYPAERCIHELIEEQVERTPDRLAVRDRKQALTYRQLNVQANRLAHLLRQEGALPNRPIGLYTSRSAEMIVGLLAIIKSGACYLPLIPTDPAARIAQQISQTQPVMIVTSRTLAPLLPQYTGAIILLDDRYEQQSPDNPQPVTTADDLVYVLFTSGSTGTPKGVATRHRNLVNYTHFICGQLGVRDDVEGWHFATVSTLAADLGNTSIFGALTSGGCLHVINYETAMTPAAFAEYLAENPVDVLKIAPSHLAMLLRESQHISVLPKKFVIIGGEKLTWELVAEISKRGRCAVMNHCGPTETTIGCCTLIVDQAAFPEPRPVTVPLGRPIANDHIYILDRHLHPVPIGVAGELHMSGAGLSSGYYNEPALTAERFIPHPFSREPGARLYRTGDLGRFWPDGTIEFLGRVDHQVKIRGFRVEPAEVEAALRRHPDVMQAIVVPDENSEREPILVAYVLGPDRGEESRLRDFLSQYLPDYMIPAAFIFLDDVPLNPNGKIDLQKLRERKPETLAKEKPFLPPRTPDQEKLAAIWTEVLGLNRVGIDESFFALGGHSLLATRIVARIRRTFHVNFPITVFLENPTIAGCAARLTEFERVDEKPHEDLAEMVRNLTDLSEEEAERLLAEAED